MRAVIPFCAALCLAICACSKFEPADSIPYSNDSFVLYANDYGYTRTSLNTSDYSLSWDEGDSLSVFCSPGGAEQYSGNLKFLCDDAAAGRFLPAAGVVVPVEPGQKYDWKAVYPFTASLESPEQIPEISRNQIQKGNGSAAHLAAYDVLAGSAPDTSTPTITMHHTGTLMKWTVQNASNAAFAVRKIAFDNTSDEYVLTVESGEEIAAGASADFFMVASPFEIKSGKEITIAVETSAGEDVQKRTFDAAKSFEAGKYNTATLACKPETSIPVFSVKKNASGKWRLYRDNEEMFIKGAAANNYYDKVPLFGGNVVRTYSVSQTKDAIGINGVYVLAGITMTSEDDGFDYNNTTQVAQQKERIRKEVSELCNNPYILGWIIGNELDASYTNSKVWSAVEDIALMIKGMDPGHLVTTALAGVKENAVKDIKQLAPSLDFISVNSYYGSALTVGETLSSHGWSKPWILSEFGPRGTWALSSGTEPPLTSWGTCIEQTSTQKAAIYKEILTSVKNNADKGCIGSCAFVWGYQTHGAVLTWYGLFDKMGYSSASVDELQYAWTGSYPTKKAPVITNRSSMLIDNSLKADSNVILKASTMHTAKVTASSTTGETLTYDWRIYKEGAHASDGSLPDGIAGLIENPTVASISFRSPATVGNYRLLVFVKDVANKKFASAVIPFNVEKNTGTNSVPDDWISGNISW